MSKVVESSYNTVDETIFAVERLLSEGRMVNDIIIVTSKTNYSDIQNRTLVEVDKVSTDGDYNMWEKIKEMFTDVSPELALEHYGIDKQTALQYNDVLKSGNYVILVKEDNGIPIRQQLENGPKELGKSSKEEKNNKPIGRGGSGSKVISNTSEPTGKSAVYYDKDVGLLNQEIDFLSEKYSGRPEDRTDENAGFSKARQLKPVGRGGSGVRKTKDTTLPEGESAMPSFEDRYLSDGTLQDNTKPITNEAKRKQSVNTYDPTDNPLQGNPTDETGNQINDRHETAVEDSQDLPRFTGNSITGQPVVDPLADKE
ncbi:Heat induced stress protein YflT [Carnobacterium iners]|uniref:Heat induced stress protein YflT n=1 Tax=Carnobacterium iners TaxID=1073423 RepID=A0A1X7NCK5_9LACT|nr:general stress protein [Carnobacterium iners]SEL10926.1 Heat induced stress protein YflT [Carnobacterium iners]SMH34964.1 Heat induced stress protein YflT [Carnobacterium iners]